MQWRRLSCFLSTICVGMLVSVSAAQSISIFEEFQQGRQALSQAKYDEAIQHFEKVLTLNPMNANAHLYLATAYGQKFVPGVDTADNVAFADQAIDHYQKVLDHDKFSTLSLSAAKGIAFLDAQMNRFDEAKDYYGRAKKLDPKDPEPYYLTAVIDWTQASQFRQQQRAKLGLKPEDSLAAKDKKICAEVKAKNWPNLEEGLDNLKKALELRPIYPDAMTYMNLMYRERADVECYDPASRKNDLKAADDWVKKASVAKQAKPPQKKKEEDEEEKAEKEPDPDLSLSPKNRKN
jgi:tetratricopeptide (TPR) repeat protein